MALRLSTFSPDAICGITPIELMLEINDFDRSRPENSRTPDKVVAGNQGRVAVPSEMVGQAVGAGMPMMVPIDTPLTFSGFGESTLQEFGPMFRQMGIAVAQGGAGTTTHSSKPVAGWEHSLNPGESVAGVLVDGDMSVTGLGTVTYNDGKKVLAFGHPFFNLGPVSMPMTKGEVLMTLASSYQPNKMANATDMVGALHQDRHSGIDGCAGRGIGDDSGDSVKVRSLDEKEAVVREKSLPLQRVRAAEVDALPDDADAVQLGFGIERFPR